MYIKKGTNFKRPTLLLTWKPEQEKDQDSTPLHHTELNDVSHTHTRNTADVDGLLEWTENVAVASAAIDGISAAQNARRVLGVLRRGRAIISSTARARDQPC